MRISNKRWILVVLVSVLSSACGEPASGPSGALAPSFATADRASGKYIVTFSGERVPVHFADDVRALGGVIDLSHDGAGLALVSELSDDAATELVKSKGVSDVLRDAIVRPSADDDLGDRADADATDVSTESHGSPTAAAFYARQWNMRAIRADAAWSAGYFGSADVTVGILDTGIDYLHPDLSGHVDLSRSISLVPAEDALLATLYPGRHPISDLRGHGTAVASIIVSNGHVIAGVTKNTTLFGVKVHNRFRQGVLSDYLRGILYAADNGADIINMSIGGQLVSPFTGGNMSKRDNPSIVAAVQRAINYANHRGVVIVVSGGNDAVDLDHDGDNFRVFCGSVHVTCVSSTAPTAAAGVNGPWTDQDLLAFTSNFGRSGIHVAAPGGNAPAQRPFTGIWNLCTTTPTSASPAVCQTGDQVFQSSGTSWSAAHTSGLAALLVERIEKGRPAQIGAAIEQSADDLGQAGTDPHYGKGRINVARALGIVP